MVTTKPNTTVKVTVASFYIKPLHIARINTEHVLSEFLMQSISQVRLQDGSTYTGTVEDIDMHSDLATVRINKVLICFVR